MPETSSRIDAEWVALNAFRGLTKIASRSDMLKSTYEKALDLGGVLYPELLGPDVSLLRKERESDLVKEYRQRATLSSIKQSKAINALDLIRAEIGELKGLISLADLDKNNKKQVDQLKKKLIHLHHAEKELSPEAHSENQLIFRDAYNVDRKLPSLKTGKGYKDFQLPDDKVLRVRVLHPDCPEHITGADIIYERHDPAEQKATIVAVQYKIWKEKTLYLSDERMIKQIQKLEKFLCHTKTCQSIAGDNSYRFPHCAAFIRPTDRLQHVDQKFISTGEHLPICRIEQCKSRGAQNAAILEYDNIRDTSLSGEMFEYLFNKGKIGSRFLRYDELEKLYSDYLIELSAENVVIYAQEFL